MLKSLEVPCLLLPAPCHLTGPHRTAAPPRGTVAMAALVSLQMIVVGYLLQLGFLDFPIWNKGYPGQRIFRIGNVSFSGQASLMEHDDPSDS